MRAPSRAAAESCGPGETTSVREGGSLTNRRTPALRAGARGRSRTARLS
jgi:hypothetical protein